MVLGREARLEHGGLQVKDTIEPSISPVAAMIVLRRLDVELREITGDLCWYCVMFSDGALGSLWATVGACRPHGDYPRIYTNVPTGLVRLPLLRESYQRGAPLHLLRFIDYTSGSRSWVVVQWRETAVSGWYAHVDVWQQRVATPSTLQELIKQLHNDSEAQQA